MLVLDGDLANSTRADIFAERRPGQFYEMGIAEQNLTGVAAGLATLGSSLSSAPSPPSRSSAPPTRCASSWRSRA